MKMKFFKEFRKFLNKITRKTLENFLKEKIKDENAKRYHLYELDD